jgi:dTDP-4-amino-4,6-dideoxygalactose transaminase
LSDLNDARVRNAQRLRAELLDVPGITVIRELAGADAVYVRLPILAESGNRRDELIAGFERAGIGATGSYPRALVDVPEVAVQLDSTIGDFEGARTIAERIITVPTHAYCPTDFAESVRNTILSCPP